MSERAPSSRRLGKAAIVVASAVLLIVVALFIGLNLQHAKEQRTDPPPQQTDPSRSKT